MASKRNENNGSIIDNRKRCHVCGRCSGLERHHAIHGVSNRKWAEVDGLWIYLCSECHWKVHNQDHDLDLELQQEAERAYLEDHTLKEWRERYGKNYL